MKRILLVIPRVSIDLYVLEEVAPLCEEIVNVVDLSQPDIVNFLL